MSSILALDGSYCSGNTTKLEKRKMLYFTSFFENVFIRSDAFFVETQQN